MNDGEGDLPRLSWDSAKTPFPVRCDSEQVDHIPKQVEHMVTNSSCFHELTMFHYAAGS